MATLTAALKDIYIFKNKCFLIKRWFSFLFMDTLCSDFMKLAFELWTPPHSYWAIKAVSVCNLPQKPIKKK